MSKYQLVPLMQQLKVENNVRKLTYKNKYLWTYLDQIETEISFKLYDNMLKYEDFINAVIKLSKLSKK